VLYTQSIDWATFYRQFDRILHEIKSERFDLIVAVARGGVIPAGLLQQELGLPLRVIAVSYRDEKNAPLYEDAKILEDGPFPVKGKTILLVDDVSRTGRTIARAREYLAGNTIKTFLLNGKTDGGAAAIKPDYELFHTDECLRMPWKRD
jgi:xanthine phosphoribosyltransferase